VGVSVAAMTLQKIEIGASNFSSNFRKITLQAEPNIIKKIDKIKVIVTERNCKHKQE
jgi:hypothetical protein